MLKPLAFAGFLALSVSASPSLPLERIAQHEASATLAQGRRNDHGLAMELEYQKALRASEQKRKEGMNLIVLCDDGKGTGLYIGDIAAAARTLKRNLTGRTDTKEIRNDDEFFAYLLAGREKIKNVFWFGHGDSESLWTTLTMPSEHAYLDSTDTAERSPAETQRIRARFTDDAVLKLYTCHPAADAIDGRPIGAALRDYLGVTVIGANSWCFAKGVRRNSGRIDVYYYPATREDYAAEFKTPIPDSAYTGESRWVEFRQGRP